MIPTTPKTATPTAAASSSADVFPRVWAPFATRGVDVEVRRRSTGGGEHNGGRAPMTREDGGWFRSPVALAPGDLYAFCVDGGPPTPDPRTRAQPEGIHGFSQVDDSGDFAWHDAGFRARPWAAAVVYELHVGCFGGTFAGCIAHLDHVRALGATHVELLPVVDGSGDRGWGYDGVDLFAPHRAYGGMRGMKELVDACHARDLAVIVDVVYNHLGPTGNYLDRFGPYFTDEHKTLWGRAVNLDQAGSDEVRRFFLDNARFWLEELHCDGLRLDAIHALWDSSATHFLEQLAREVRALEAALARPLVLVAESDLNDPRVIRPVDAGGLGMDAQWSDDLHHALHATLTGEQSGYYAAYHRGLADVAHALERGYVYEGRYSKARGRAHGRPLGDDVERSRLLGYLQTHDQVGNRARGERIAHLTSIDRALAGAALYLLSPCTPMIFMGEEWAASAPFRFFTDHREPELAQSVRDGRRREFAAFGWNPDDIPDPQAPATFTASVLDFAERERAPHARVLETYRALLRLRRRLLSAAPARVCRAFADVDEHTLLVDRGALVVAVNLAGAARVIDLAQVPAAKSHSVLLASCEVHHEGARLHVAQDGFAILGEDEGEKRGARS